MIEIRDRQLITDGIPFIAFAAILRNVGRRSIIELAQRTAAPTIRSPR